MQNLLFICSRNQWRSPTAEAIYKDREGIQVRSAGTEQSARIKVSAKLIEWADLIFVMEKKHRERLLIKFQGVMEGKQVVNLDIPDEYGFMDEELIDAIRRSVDPFLNE